MEEDSEATSGDTASDAPPGSDGTPDPAPQEDDPPADASPGASDGTLAGDDPGDRAEPAPGDEPVAMEEPAPDHEPVPVDEPVAVADAAAPGDDAGPESTAPRDDVDGAIVAALDAVAATLDQLCVRVAALEEAAAAPPPDSGVRDAIDAVERRVAEVARLGDRHNELIDKLHAENQLLRKGELSQAMSPVLRDLVRLSDQLSVLDQTSPEPGSGDAALAGRQVLEILARAGVVDAEVAVGERFDPARHQGLGRVPTDDPAADGCIAGVRARGFLGPDGRMLRAAEVEVWRLTPAPDPAPDAPGPPADAPVPPAEAPVAVPPPSPPTPDEPGASEGDV